MARRRRKRIVTASPMELSGVADERSDKNEAMHCEERRRAINRDEVERRTVAIQAIRAVETESLLSRMRLFRLFVKDHLEIPALQFFEQNLPNLSVTRNEKDKTFELNWRDIERHGDGRDVRGSLESVITSDSLGDFTMSVDSVRKNFFQTANMQITDSVAEEPSEDRMLGTKDVFQTPGEMGSMLSFITTPKTSRLPKNGEMLLSFHGSPLGVYKEENLEAIKESGEDSQKGTS